MLHLQLPQLGARLQAAAPPSTPRAPGSHLKRGPMAATCRFMLPAAPPMLSDRERCSRLQKISTWSELQYLAISNRCTRNCRGRGTCCLWGPPEGRWGLQGRGRVSGGEGVQYRPLPEGHLQPGASGQPQPGGRVGEAWGARTSIQM